MKLDWQVNVSYSNTNQNTTVVFLAHLNIQMCSCYWDLHICRKSALLGPSLYVDTQEKYQRGVLGWGVLSQSQPRYNRRCVKPSASSSKGGPKDVKSLKLPPTPQGAWPQPAAGLWWQGGVPRSLGNSGIRKGLRRATVYICLLGILWPFQLGTPPPPRSVASEISNR